MKMGAVAGAGGERLAHERSAESLLGGDFLGGVLEEEGPVGGGEGVGVPDVDLELAGAELVVTGEDGNAQRAGTAQQQGNDLGRVVGDADDVAGGVPVEVLAPAVRGGGI